MLISTITPQTQNPPELSLVDTDTTACGKMSREAAEKQPHVSLYHSSRLGKLSKYIWFAPCGGRIIRRITKLNLASNICANQAFLTDMLSTIPIERNKIYSEELRPSIPIQPSLRFGDKTYRFEYVCIRGNIIKANIELCYFLQESSIVLNFHTTLEGSTNPRKFFEDLERSYAYVDQVSKIGGRHYDPDGENGFWKVTSKSKRHYELYDETRLDDDDEYYCYLCKKFGHCAREQECPFEKPGKYLRKDDK